MKLWDNTTSCPGDCDQVRKMFWPICYFLFQRFFLSDKRGPPLVPVVLEGSGEECTKCPCGQKCLYVHKEISDNSVKGTKKIGKLQLDVTYHFPPRKSPNSCNPLCWRYQFHSSRWRWNILQAEGSFIFNSKEFIILVFCSQFLLYCYSGSSLVWLHHQLLQYEEPHGGGWHGGVRGVQGGVQHRFMHAVW